MKKAFYDLNHGPPFDTGPNRGNIFINVKLILVVMQLNKNE